MTKRLPVSVIICTWNRAGLLEQTLASLAGQAGVPADEVEVIVVDNNSSDATRETVARCASAWTLGTLRYEFEPRQGKQFALNRGIAAASHGVLAFTDDDILFPSDWLHAIREVFVDPDIELAGGKTQIAWSASGRPDWFADDMAAVLGGVDLGNARLDPAPPDYAPAGANLIARRALFARLGGYSETHFRHMDYEFGMRCRRAGARVIYEPRLSVSAPVDDACLSRRYFRRWAFKAGIARNKGSASPDGQHPLVARWIYRQVAEDAVSLGVPFGKTAAQRFSRELRMWRGLGTIADAWHARLFPARHVQWVERYSQKRKNLY